MIRLVTRAVAIGAVLLTLGGAKAWAGMKEATAAYNRGDYATAVREFRRLAEQGDAEAQNKLGLMYRNGRGVPRDYAEAAKWYRKAADEGNTEAQYELGGMYKFGQGVPRDNVLAYSWFRGTGLPVTTS